MAEYLLLNKPYRVLPSFTDPDFERGVRETARATLADFVPVAGVYPAGRLDYDSEGLLLLTDDGALAHRLTHPRYYHPKKYLVQVEGEPEESTLDRLRQGGLLIRGHRTRPVRVRRLEPAPDLWERDPPVRFRKSVPDCWLELHLTEGKNRQVRRMTAAVGHPTLRLVRAAIGPLTLGNLAPGDWRRLTPVEIRALQRIDPRSAGR